MDYLKDLLPNWYKQYPAITTIAIIVVYNAFAMLTWMGVRHAAQEAKTETGTHIRIDSPIKTGNCSAAGIGQANGVSIQCDDKTATRTEQKESLQ
jgi:hypothetical protein